MNNIVIAFVMVLALLTAGTVLVAKSTKKAESNPANLAREPGAQIADSHVMSPEPGLHPYGTTNESSEVDGALIDGTVAREWGDFIKAKDIRIDCRDVRQVIRAQPRPEDYRRECGHVTVFDHPYAGFTDAQLEQIADYDAEAAYLIAHRLLIQPSQGNTIDQNPQRGLSYAMYALVQTGEKQVFDLMLAGRHFRNWAVWSTVDGVPSPREIREKEEEYIWSKAGHNLGLVDDDDYRWRRLLGVMRRFESYFDQNELNARATEISDGVMERRSRVMGD